MRTDRHRGHQAAGAQLTRPAAVTISDHDAYSAATAQLPLVELDARARQILLDGGHRPQPSMVSLDEPEHAGHELTFHPNISFRGPPDIAGKRGAGG